LVDVLRLEADFFGSWAVGGPFLVSSVTGQAVKSREFESIETGPNVIKQEVFSYTRQVLGKAMLMGAF
jgi:hypothetical protein